MSGPRLSLVVIVALAGCAGDERPEPEENDVDCDPFAVDVVSFSPGEHAGFGSDRFPQIVFGPPGGGEDGGGSLDVLSLGVGGSIVVELGCAASDGDGVDLVVYENAFVVGAPDTDTGASTHFVEVADVAVSADGVTFVAFACDKPASTLAHDDGIDGCAGMATVAAGATGVFPDDGGDGFDLATVGLAEARFVRITDRSTSGSADTAGFDLDAVAAIVRD